METLLSMQRWLECSLGFCWLAPSIKILIRSVIILKYSSKVNWVKEDSILHTFYPFSNSGIYAKEKCCLAISIIVFIDICRDISKSCFLCLYIYLSGQNFSKILYPDKYIFNWHIATKKYLLIKIFKYYVLLQCP